MASCSCEAVFTLDVLARGITQRAEHQRAQLSIVNEVALSPDMSSNLPGQPWFHAACGAGQQLGFNVQARLLGDHA